MPHSRSARSASLALLLLSLLAALPAATQEIRGRVVEGTTQRGVEAAIVSLLDGGDETVARTQTDGAGTFVLRAPGPGAYRVRTERVGYAATVSEPVDLADGGTSQLLVRLTAEAVRVEAVTVTTRAAAPTTGALASRGFHERRETGPGHFVDRAEIERRNVTQTSQVFVGTAGARLVRVGDGGAYDVRLNRAEQECIPAVYIDGSLVRQGGRPRQMGATLAQPQPQTRGRAGGVRQAPSVMAVMDEEGNPMYDLDHVPIDKLIDPDMIEAMEVYRGPAETPVQFGGPYARCGVIVIWTRQGS